MNTPNHTHKLVQGLAAAAFVAGGAAAFATAANENQTWSFSVGNAKAGGMQPQVIVRSIEPEGGKRAHEKVTWLGVSTEESEEALTAQLGLKRGQGLLVTYVAPESPAAKAGLTRNDVLVQFGDQLLVHPEQLRKLVQMHEEGDPVRLSYYRGGKQQTASVSLGRAAPRVGFWNEELFRPENLQGMNLQGLANMGNLKTLQDALKHAGMDKASVDSEVRRNLERAHEALVKSLQQTTNGHRLLAPVAKELEELAKSLNFNKDATVTVKSHNNQVRTIVKTDESGTFVIVANPKKRLTVHDQDGKLLFDGEIETPEQQQKVPKSLWEKTQPMIEQLNQSKANEPEEPAQPDKAAQTIGDNDPEEKT